LAKAKMMREQQQGRKEWEENIFFIENLWGVGKVLARGYNSAED
jgi:hypothetical protein